MKREELIKYKADENFGNGLVYSILEVNQVLDENDAEIEDLLRQNRELCQALQVMYSKEEYGKLQTENESLKAKLESVQASAYADSVDAGMRERRLRRALWLVRAERYKMREFIAREEGNLSSQMSWSRFLRERTYNQWVGQLLKIANLANKLQNKCLAMAEKFK